MARPRDARAAARAIGAGGRRGPAGARGRAPAPARRDPQRAGVVAEGGRTARAGSDGCAIAFCSSEEISELKAIQKVLGTSIPVASGKPWVDFDADMRTSKKTKLRSKNRWNRKKFGSSSKKNSSFSSPQKSHRGRSGKAALVA